MVYADFAYYCNAYFGRTIPAEDFPRLALRNIQYLDYIAQGRAEAHTGLETVQMACRALAEQYRAIDAARALADKALSGSLQSEGPELQSQTVGNWTKSYRSSGNSAQDAAKAAAADGITGQAREFISPEVFREMEDKSGVWTLAAGNTFFVKNEVIEPEAGRGDWEKYRAVYSVTKVAERDFGTPDMRHWEVGGQ